MQTSGAVMALWENAAFEQWLDNLDVRVTGKHVPLFWIKFVLFKHCLFFQQFSWLQCGDCTKKSNVIVKKKPSVNQQWFIYVQRSNFLVQILKSLLLELSHYSTWENKVPNLQFFCATTHCHQRECKSPHLSLTSSFFPWLYKTLWDA